MRVAAGVCEHHTLGEPASSTDVRGLDYLDLPALRPDFLGVERAGVVDDDHLEVPVHLGEPLDDVSADSRGVAGDVVLLAVCCGREEESRPVDLSRVFRDCRVGGGLQPYGVLALDFE